MGTDIILRYLENHKGIWYKAKDLSNSLNIEYRILLKNLESLRNTDWIEWKKEEEVGRTNIPNSTYFYRYRKMDEEIKQIQNDIERLVEDTDFSREVVAELLMIKELRKLNKK